MSSISNYFPVTQHIASSGQPFEDQFALIAEEGFDGVINLSMPSSDNAIANEEELVTALGMAYIHLPIPWESPTLQHYFDFVKAMELFKGKKVWVHCAMNMRASCMLYLYRRKHLGESKEIALHPMRHIWQPEGAWRRMVEEVLSLPEVA